MDTSQITTALQLSDQRSDGLEMKTNDNNNFEASSNLDNGTDDVGIQTQELISTNKPLDMITKVMKSQKFDPYENLDNDVRKERLPLHGEQMATTPRVLVSNISQEKGTTQTHESFGIECKETSQTIILDEDHTENDGKRLAGSSLNGTSTEPDAEADPPSLHEHPPLYDLPPLPLYLALIDDEPPHEPSDGVSNPTPLSIYLALVDEQPPHESSDVVSDPTLIPLYLALIDEEPCHKTTDSTACVVTNSYEEISKDLEARAKDNYYEKELLCDSPFVVSAKLDKRNSVGEDYDTINEYDYIPGIGEQCGVHGPRSRPLPVVPFDIYEPLNLSNINDSSIMSRKRRILIGKISLVLTVLVLFVVTAVVPIVVVLNNASHHRNVVTNIATSTAATTVTSLEQESSSQSTPITLTTMEQGGKNRETDTRWSARSFLDNPVLLNVISVNESIRGITVMESQLFVVGDWPQVSVYDTGNFTMIRSIPITPYSSLYGIVASERFNCLYISDHGFNVVHRYNLSNNVISNWSVGGHCYGLSLTSTHNVLVTLYYTKQIKEYTPYGGLIREISLHSIIDAPYHIIPQTSDRFVVSNGYYYVSLHQVCIVDSGERIIQCYGGSLGSGIGQFNRPRQLTVDEHCNMMVADRDNNRVELLSPSLTHLGYIKIPGHQLNGPYALHLDEQTHRLYIGESTYGTGRVFVLTA